MENNHPMLFILRNRICDNFCYNIFNMDSCAGILPAYAPYWCPILCLTWFTSVADIVLVPFPIRYEKYGVTITNSDIMVYYFNDATKLDGCKLYTSHTFISNRTRIHWTSRASLSLSWNFSTVVENFQYLVA